MPPKRKATGAGVGGKKAKTEPSSAQPSAARQMAEVLKKAGNDRKKTVKVDSYCSQFANNGRVSLAAFYERFQVKVYTSLCLNFTSRNMKVRSNFTVETTFISVSSFVIFNGIQPILPAIY